MSSNPDTVRVPDAAFKSNEKLAGESVSDVYSTVMPELVIEVNSPSDSYTKLQEWFRTGLRQV